MRAQPELLQLSQTAFDPLRQITATHGLETIAARPGDSGPTPLFLEMISDPAVDIRVQTELVWALEKLRIPGPCQP